MAHLSIYGIPIECSASEWDPIELGEITRSLNGAPRSSKRVKKRDHRFTTDVGGMLLEEAEVVRALITGEGHAWSFDTGSMVERMTSSRGLLATIIGSVAFPLGKFGDAARLVHPFDATWSLEPTRPSTYAYWRLEGVDWIHYIVRENADFSVSVWVDAARNDGANPGIISQPLDATLYATTNVTGEDEWIDDLIYLPYGIPDAWMDGSDSIPAAAFLTFRQSNPWGALPLVKAAGPGVPSNGLTAVGEVYTGRRVPMREADGTFTTGEVFDFKLMGT